MNFDHLATMFTSSLLTYESIKLRNFGLTLLSGLIEVTNLGINVKNHPVTLMAFMDGFHLKELPLDSHNKEDIVIRERERER